MDLGDLGGRAVSAEHPAGEDVRGTAEFEALQAEIDRVNDAANPGQTDWAKVVKLATDILSTQGKDLLVGSYLAVGLMKLERVEGFAQGLRVLRDMIVQHWDGLFPSVKRMRGRRNALQYWLDATEELMRDANPAPFEQEQVDAMKTCIDEIDAVLREKDDEPPAVFRLASVVNGFPVRVEEAPAETEPAAAEPQPAADEAAAVASGTVASAEDAERNIEAAFNALSAAADFLFEHDTANALSYRISRWVAWSRVPALDADASGRTIFPPPDAPYIEMLASVEAGGDPVAALRFSQAQFATNPFWLDLNRCAARALQALGDDHAEAARAILFESALFAARVGGGALQFSDGMPFASPQTRQWLAEVGTGSASNTGSQSTLSREVSDAMQRAAELAGSGDILGAAAALQEGIGKAAGEKERFQARLTFGEQLLARQALADPWPFVQPVLEDIDRYQLEEWDPALAVAGLRLVFSGVAVAGESAVGAPTLPHLLKRIALLDYGEALRLAGAQ